jgi:hypothetical protein
LFGGVDEINGVDVKGGLDEVFEVRERRPGFVGQTKPTENFEELEDSEEMGENPIPEESPLWMGFKSGFTDNLPSEQGVTIQEGPWEGGTVAQVSRTELDLESWYGEDHGDRVEMMFSPRHDKDKVGETAQGLAASDRVDRDVVDGADEDAREQGVVGHSQKLAKAREEEGFVPKVTRRDFDSTSEGAAHMEFQGFMRSIDDFVDLQRAMHGDHLDEVPERNGILEFFEVPSRATFLVPPRKYRSLPPLEP